MSVKTDPADTLAILCGGQSRRLGSDKGLYKPNGDETLVERMIRRFKSHFQKILVVVKDETQRQLYRQILTANPSESLADIKIITDEESSQHSFIDSTLTGIYSALSYLHAVGEAGDLVTIAVDQVALRPLHINTLRQASADHLTAECVSFQAGDDIFPLPTLWRTSAREHLGARLAARALAVKSCVYELRSHFVAAGAFKDELSVNTNEALSLGTYFGRSIYDTYRRRMHYLRFSLIESCNMACQYCLPEGFPEWYRHKARLNAADIETILLGFRQLGFEKVRFTGGEPTLHPNCLSAIERARKIGFEQISLTTNGLLIRDLKKWQDAGLTSLNVSLDSLSPAIFQSITQSDKLNTVLDLIDNAIHIGLPVKINTVLLRSKNGQPDQIEELIRWAISKPVALRFIELMPTKLNSSFENRERVSGEEIKSFLTTYGLAPQGETFSARVDGPATYYVSANYPGKIGLINPLSCNFCHKCNRLRVTAKAGLRLCLFGDHDLPLDLSSPNALAEQVRKLIEGKKEKHHLEKGELGNVFTFRTIGG